MEIAGIYLNGAGSPGDPFNSLGKIVVPHITVEYTRNLDGFDPAKVLAGVNRACLDSGLFSEADIKARAMAIDCFAVGTAGQDRGFVHVRIALLSGRGSEERKALSDTVLAALSSGGHAMGGMEVQLSVETVEIDLPSYAKALVQG